MLLGLVGQKVIQIGGFQTFSLCRHQSVFFMENGGSVHKTHERAASPAEKGVGAHSRPAPALERRSPEGPGLSLETC